MIAESSRNPSSGPLRSGPSKPLKRGKACSVCRALKIKCDGAKPICGPCMRSTKPDPCEYDNGLGKSRTRVLEETISRLEARVWELENPNASTPPVTLHDPYIEYNQARQSHSPPASIPDPPRHGPLSPFSPSSTRSSLPSGRHWSNFAALETMTQSTGSSTSSISPSHPLLCLSPSSSNEEPPQPTMKFLLEIFLPHAAEYGFFLDISSFHQSVMLPHPFGHPQRPTRALLTTAYLWGTHLSRPNVPPHVEESTLLFRALQYVATDTLLDHPKRVIHTLQAEVLLAAYFFRTGHFLEAKCRLGSAISLALSFQLHKLRSVNYPPARLLGIHDNYPVLPPDSETMMEEGERINGFWAVFTLHKMMSVALEPSSGVCGALEAPGLQIDTPWPCDIHDYNNPSLNNEIQGNATIKYFLAGFFFNGRNDTSLTALLAKASTLCHRATHLIGQWSPSMPKKEMDAFTAAFRSIDKLIDDFRIWIPPLQPGVNTATTRTLLLIHSLTNTAIIKLHGAFSYSDAVSNQRCVQAACDMFNFAGIDIQRLNYVNPVYGMLWQTACQVLIDEISRRQQSQTAWLTSVNEDDLQNRLKVGLGALSTFSNQCVFIRYQKSKVEEAYNAITGAIVYETTTH